MEAGSGFLSFFSAAAEITDADAIMAADAAAASATSLAETTDVDVKASSGSLSCLAAAAEIPAANPGQSLDVPKNRLLKGPIFLNGRILRVSSVVCIIPVHFS